MPLPSITLPKPVKYDTSGLKNALSSMIEMDKIKSNREYRDKQLAASQKSANALAQYRQNTDDRATAKAMDEEITNSLAYVGAVDDPAIAQQRYQSIVDYATKNDKSGRLSGRMMPPEYFVNPDTQAFDVSKFREYTTNVQSTLKGVRDAKEGATLTFEVKNPNHDPSQPASIDNPMAIKITRIKKGNTYVTDPNLPDQPIVSAFEKEGAKTNTPFELYAAGKRKAGWTDAEISMGWNQEQKKVREGSRAPTTVTITGNVAMNPESGKKEYLMTDGTFSGKEAAAKPSNKQERDLSAILKKKPGASAPTATQAAPTSYQGMPVRKIARDTATGKIMQVLLDDGTPQGKVVDYVESK